MIQFGFKNAGKTHFGRLLAKELGKQFIDTDEEIVKVFGIGTIRQIYEVLGEDDFRGLESQVIYSLSEVRDSVISVGGGSVLREVNVEFLKRLGQLIYLNASFQTIEKRVLAQGKPAFNAIESLQKIYHDRIPLYESIPARKINTDDFDEAGVLAELKTILLLEDPTDGL